MFCGTGAAANTAVLAKATTDNADSAKRRPRRFESKLMKISPVAKCAIERAPPRNTPKPTFRVQSLIDRGRQRGCRRPTIFAREGTSNRYIRERLRIARKRRNSTFQKENGAPKRPVPFLQNDLRSVFEAACGAAKDQLAQDFDRARRRGAAALRVDDRRGDVL